MVTTNEDPCAKPGWDVFISYNRGDAAWVNGYLKRVLDAAGVTFAIDEKDFDIGARLDESIRELIKECRYTLLVMTPEWVKGKWTSYEAELAVHKQAGNNRVNILPLKLKDCDVPPDLATRLYLDICQARTRDDEIVKLLRQIGVAEEKIAKARLSIAKKTWDFLQELLADARVRDQIQKLDDTFSEVQRSNLVLHTNKTLHDQLQAIEFPLQELKNLLAEYNAGESRTGWSRMQGAASALRVTLKKLISYAETISDGLVDVNFTTTLKPFAERIYSAYQSKDAGQLSTYLDFVQQKVSKSLPIINERIVQHVKGSRLSETVETIYTMVHDIEFEDDVSDLLKQFRAKIDELVELEVSILSKVRDHGKLQNAEENLLLCSPGGAPMFSAISDFWAMVDAFIGELSKNDRYQRLSELGQQLSNELQSITVRDEMFVEKVITEYQDFCLELKDCFNKLDVDLLADCGELQPRSDELYQILQRMQNNANRK